MIESRSIASRVSDKLNIVLLLLIAFAALFPMIHVLALSFSSKAATEGGLVTLWPIGFNTDAYSRILETGAFLQSFKVTVFRTIVGTALNMLITILTAYPLAKTAREMKGRDAFMWFMLFALLFNGGLIPMFLQVKNLGLLDTFWALVLPGVLPIWNVILMMNFFRGVPKELEEAAVVDGASHWEMLWRIYVPLSVPAIATLTLFAAVGHWNAWFDGLIYINNPDLMPLQTFLRGVLIENTSTQIVRDVQDLAQATNRSLKAAQIFIATAPILAVYPFLQRYFVTGIRLGAVKG